MPQSFRAVILLILLSEPLIGQTPALPSERHLRNIRQLTFGGENAEAYFSFDERTLIFQSTRDSFLCDQIFTLDIEKQTVRLVSGGEGRNTCAYFLPGDSTVIYSSTHLREPECPPKPDYSKGYVWPLHSSYDIFEAKRDGGVIRRLTTSEGYDAEATVSPNGDRIVFTSSRSGDLELYSMRLDGGEASRLTFEAGYDGGAFYSWDGKRIVYRGYHPGKPEEVEEYRALLKEGLVRPSIMELYVMNADGSSKRQITGAGAASFAPFFHPDNRRVIFASNLHDPQGRNFDLYIVNTDGTGLERITFHETFDGFPIFNRSGTKLVFASNRNGTKRGETNIFIADWVE